MTEESQQMRGNKFKKSDSERLRKLSKDLEKLLIESQELRPGDLHIRVEGKEGPSTR